MKQQGMFGLRKKPEKDKCCICFSVMNTRNPMKWFECKAHKGHSRCVGATIIDKITATYALLDVRMFKDNDLMIHYI